MVLWKKEVCLGYENTSLILHTLFLLCTYARCNLYYIFLDMYFRMHIWGYVYYSKYICFVLFLLPNSLQIVKLDSRSIMYIISYPNKECTPKSSYVSYMPSCGWCHISHQTHISFLDTQTYDYKIYGWYFKFDLIVKNKYYENAKTWC